MKLYELRSVNFVHQADGDAFPVIYSKSILDLFFILTFWLSKHLEVDFQSTMTRNASLR